jgi:hypothetical protein
MYLSVISARLHAENVESANKMSARLSEAADMAVWTGCRLGNKHGASIPVWVAFLVEAKDPAAAEKMAIDRLIDSLASGENRSRFTINGSHPEVQPAEKPRIFVAKARRVSALDVIQFARDQCNGLPERFPLNLVPMATESMGTRVTIGTAPPAANMPDDYFGLGSYEGFDPVARSAPSDGCLLPQGFYWRSASQRSEAAAVQIHGAWWIGASHTYAGVLAYRQEPLGWDAKTALELPGPKSKKGAYLPGVSFLFNEPLWPTTKAETGPNVGRSSAAYDWHALRVIADNGGTADPVLWRLLRKGVEFHARFGHAVRSKAMAAYDLWSAARQIQEEARWRQIAPNARMTERDRNDLLRNGAKILRECAKSAGPVTTKLRELARRFENDRIPEPQEAFVLIAVLLEEAARTLE